MTKIKVGVIWLNVICILFVLLGVTLAFFSQTKIINFLFNNQIDPVFSSTSLSAQTLALQKWIYGVFGATCAGWGITLAFIVNFAFAKRQNWSRFAIIAGIGMWFLLDTSISIICHVWFNVEFNVLVLVLGIIPFIFTRKEFSS